MACRKTETVARRIIGAHLGAEYPHLVGEWASEFAAAAAEQSRDIDEREFAAELESAMVDVVVELADAED